MQPKVMLESARDGVVRLRFPERVDLSLGYHVWRLCGTLGEGYRECVADLGDTSAVFDSGVAMLLVLHRRLGRKGCRLTLVNCPADAEQRCLALGLAVDSSGRRDTSEDPGSAPYVCA
jgi:anti-anti-sigma regulatory factor